MKSLGYNYKPAEIAEGPRLEGQGLGTRDRASAAYHDHLEGHALAIRDPGSSVSSLRRLFYRVALPKKVLPREELIEALGAKNRCELIIGGTIQADLGVMQLYRGDLEELLVPFWRERDWKN